MKPSELQSALLRLHFSTRDAVLAARYGAALRHFATGQGGAFETVQLGRDAVTYAAVAFQALGDAADEARAKGALDALQGRTVVAQGTGRRRGRADAAG